jgi:hypothetical protein
MKNQWRLPLVQVVSHIEPQLVSTNYQLGSGLKSDGCSRLIILKKLSWNETSNRPMTKEKIYEVIITFVVFLLAASAIGYLIFPSAMLSVVGITSNEQMDFLVRTLAVALVALIPSSWSARKRGNASLYQSVIFGLAIYMFLSSGVDLHAFFTHIVNSTSIPSIILRVFIGVVLLWLIPRP